MIDPKYNRFNSMKTLVYADRIKQLLASGMCDPVVLHLYLTNKCNRNCWWCIMKDERIAHHSASLSMDCISRLIDDISAMGVQMVHISGGGEPMLHPELLRIASLIKAAGCKVALSTNFAAPLSAPASWLDQLSRSVDYLRVSINAGNRDLYASECGSTPEEYDLVWSRLHELVDLRKQSGSTMDIGVGFIISPTNWHSLYQFCWKASRVGVDFVHARPAYLDDEADATLMELVPKIVELSNKAADFSPFVDIYTITDKFKGYWTPRQYKRCLSTPLSAVVAATGDVILCQDVFTSFGNIEQASFKDIWYSEAHKQAIDRIDLSKCPRCVESAQNEIIEHVFINDSMRLAIL